ncbi:F0F1-type ATP synthase [Sarcoptes scabiei]|nr:F0F1-type ATP synthase [Sarcoptes scabiei]
MIVILPLTNTERDKRREKKIYLHFESISSFVSFGGDLIVSRFKKKNSQHRITSILRLKVLNLSTKKKATIDNNALEIEKHKSDDTGIFGFKLKSKQTMMLITAREI